jgi:hypothetical protein
MNRRFFQNLTAPLLLLLPAFGAAHAEPVTVTLSDDGHAADLAPDFLGLSYESSTLLPHNGHYYFDPADKPLLHTFRTLGIKSIRVGANAVDDPRVPVPRGQDIDALFGFARAAGAKVIYSFRLKNGDPADSARLAGSIAARDGDALECYAIGNEPNFYLKTYEAFFAQWKPHYDAILSAVPSAMFDGPSAFGNYALKLAHDLYAKGHLAMASDHYYFLGSGRAGEKDPAATRARFLSNNVDATYAKAYAKTGAVLAAEGVPYRIDELNSCYNGGSKDSSDTYAATLWALDCTHWWAAHGILGMNYHTGESVGRDGGFAAPNYSSFTHLQDGLGLYERPVAYGLLAFTQGAHGHPLEVAAQTPPGFNFNAYAYRDHGGSIYATLINKSYGANAMPADVTLQLPKGVAAGQWTRMDLVQKDQDVAAKTGVILGGSPIDTQGAWAGQWKTIEAANSGRVTLQVAPASATILHFSPAADIAGAAVNSR